MAYILDSSVLIALERESKALGDLAATVEVDKTVVIASITVSELLTGVHRADTAERRKRRETFVEAIFTALPVIPFDIQCARSHAVIVTNLATHGSLIGANDLLIAATALAYGYTVLTHNMRDFGRIDGLSVRQALSSY